MNLPNNALKYLNKYSFSGWEVETNQTKLFNNAIVIPAISEFENIKNSLASLSNNDRKYFNSTIVLFVINNPVSADSDVKSDNLKSIEYFFITLSFLHLDATIIERSSSFARERSSFKIM